MNTVEGFIYTQADSYDVFLPVDLADQLSDGGNKGWVSLALVSSDEYICLRARDITFFRRQMTVDEKQKRHTVNRRARLEVEESL